MIAKKNIRLLALHNFFVDFSPFMPVAIIYFATITGSFALGMTMFSIVMVSSAIFEVPTGILSDFVGRKKTFLLGSIAGFFGVTCYALGGSFWLLAIGSVFEGLAYSFYSGNNTAFLHETLREEGRTEEYAHLLGRTNALCQVGLGTSAVLGSAVAFFFPLRVLFLIGIIPRFACIVVSLLLHEPAVREKELTGNVFSHLRDAAMEFKRNAKLRTLSIASIINFGMGEASYQFTPAFFASLWPVWAMGLARVVSNITGFLGFWFAGPVIRRFKELKSLIAGKLFGSGISLFAMLFPTVLSPALDSCASLTFGLQHTAENSLLQREFTHRQRATMGSLNQFAGSILFGIAAFVLGLVADSIGPTRALIIAECIIMANILLYWRLFRHETPGSLDAVVIRDYRTEDADQVWKLHEIALKATNAFVAGHGKWDEDLKNIPQVYLSGKGSFLVAELGGEIVGMGALRLVSEETAEIKRMRVLPEFQGKGLGTKLLKCLEGKAKELGYKRLILDTSTRQEIAVHLYDKFGYTECKRGMLGGLETIYMEKRIV